MERAPTFEHFSDPEYGERYGRSRRDGKPAESPRKRRAYKDPFHVMSMLSKCILPLSDGFFDKQADGD